MDKIIPFNYNAKQLRTILKNDEPWFVAKDICDILDLGNVTMAVTRLPVIMKGINTIDTLGGPQDMLTVSEAGLYKLIFTSRKYEAERFTNWVAGEVIPAIRKTGSYALDLQRQHIPKSYPEALRLAADLEEERQKLLPKAKSYDVLMNASGLLTMNEVAKLLDIEGTGQNNFFRLLAENNIIYKKGDCYLPYQEYKSHFIVKQRPIYKGDAILQRSQLYMSIKGVDWLARKLIDMGFQLNYSDYKRREKIL